MREFEKFTVIRRKSRPTQLSVYPHGTALSLGEDHIGITVVEFQAVKELQDEIARLKKELVRIASVEVAKTHRGTLEKLAKDEKMEGE